MTPEQAKRLAPVIAAFGDGKEVQRQTLALVGFSWKIDESPNFDPRFNWRVKPEKLVRWMNIYSGSENSVVHGTRTSADYAAGSERIACICVEFEEGEGL